MLLELTPMGVITSTFVPVGESVRVHLAENSLIITLAKILWAFEVRAPLGPDGREEEVDVSDAAYEPGINTLPKPYKVRFIARSPEIERTLRREWTTAQQDGFMLGNVQVDTVGMKSAKRS
jgi:hypothetical protein